MSTPSDKLPDANYQPKLYQHFFFWYKKENPYRLVRILFISIAIEKTTVVT